VNLGSKTWPGKKITEKTTWVLWSCCDHGAHRCTETGMMDSVHGPPTPSTEW